MPEATEFNEKNFRKPLFYCDIMCSLCCLWIHATDFHLTFTYSNCGEKYKDQFEQPTKNKIQLFTLNQVKKPKLGFVLSKKKI